MPRTWYVYVPTPQSDNLSLGLAKETWGWKRTALERGRNKHEADRIRSGDLLTFGHRGPNSRVAPDGWATAQLGRVVVTEVVKPLYLSDVRLWPDDPYPYRVDFAMLDHATKALPPEGMEALRMSANKNGVPVAAGGPDQVDLVAEAVKSFEVRPQLVTVRRLEQSAIRRMKLGTASEVGCDLCGRLYPAAVAQVLHVKRRSACTEAEWRDLANVLVACALGCAELFDGGYVYVGEDGKVHGTASATATPDLALFTAGLVGRACAAFDSSSAVYFADHRERVCRG